MMYVFKIPKAAPIMPWSYDVEYSGVGGVSARHGARHHHRSRRGASYFAAGRQSNAAAGGATARVSAIFTAKEAIVGDARSAIVVSRDRQRVRGFRRRPEARRRPAGGASRRTQHRRDFGVRL